MLGLSLGKLLFLALIIAVVWYGFKYQRRLEEIRGMLRREMRSRQARQRPQGLDVEDLVKCPRCGAYVAARDAAACGRADCPWGR